ncbi:MAG TPA: hypothetical protein VMU50_01790, partial [Polyangia bacterium]|nr:hypothetical protein [Polyangia bacterium]
MRLVGIRSAAWKLTTVAALGLLGCRGSASLQPSAPPAKNAETATPPRTPPPVPVRPAPAPPPAPVPESEALKAREDLPPEKRALVIVDGQERWVDAAAIASAGYTLVDLRDDWTPFIFAEQMTPDGQPLPNRYRRIFIGLANDQLDNDGEPLPPGEKNYLELYGIPPSLSVLRARFVGDAEHPCHDQQSADVLDAVETVSYVAPKDIKREERRLARLRQELELARRKAHVKTLDALAAKRPELAVKVKFVAKRAAEKPAMAAVEKRLACEGLLTPKSKHQVGIYDDAMRLAVRRFQ